MIPGACRPSLMCTSLSETRRIGSSKFFYATTLNFERRTCGHSEARNHPYPRYAQLQEAPAPKLPVQIGSYIPQNDRQDLNKHKKTDAGDLHTNSGCNSPFCEISSIFDLIMGWWRTCPGSQKGVGNFFCAPEFFSILKIFTRGRFSRGPRGPKKASLGGICLNRPRTRDFEF